MLLFVEVTGTPVTPQLSPLACLPPLAAGQVTSRFRAFYGNLPEPPVAPIEFTWRRRSGPVEDTLGKEFDAPHWEAFSASLNTLKLGDAAANRPTRQLVRRLKGLSSSCGLFLFFDPRPPICSSGHLRKSRHAGPSSRPPLVALCCSKKPLGSRYGGRPISSTPNRPPRVRPTEDLPIRPHLGQGSPCRILQALRCRPMRCSSRCWRRGLVQARDKITVSENRCQRPRTFSNDKTRPPLRDIVQNSSAATVCAIMAMEPARQAANPERRFAASPHPSSAPVPSDRVSPSSH